MRALTVPASLPPSASGRGRAGRDISDHPHARSSSRRAQVLIAKEPAGSSLPFPAELAGPMQKYASRYYSALVLPSAPRYGRTLVRRAVIWGLR